MLTWAVRHGARWGSFPCMPVVTVRTIPLVLLRRSLELFRTYKFLRMNVSVSLWNSPRASSSLATSVLPVCSAQSPAADTQFRSTQKHPKIELLVRLSTAKTKMRQTSRKSRFLFSHKLCMDPFLNMDSRWVYIAYNC